MTRGADVSYAKASDAIGQKTSRVPRRIVLKYLVVQAVPGYFRFPHERRSSAISSPGRSQVEVGKCGLADIAGDFRSNRRGSTGLALMPASLQKCDQFLKALFDACGLRRIDIRLRSMSLDEVQVCAGGLRRFIRSVNGYVLKRARDVVVRSPFFCHWRFRRCISRPRAWIRRWLPGSERGRNVGFEFQVFRVPLARDQSARAIAGGETNREQKNYDKEPYHQTIRTLSQFCPKAACYCLYPVVDYLKARLFAFVCIALDISRLRVRQDLH